MKTLTFLVEWWPLIAAVGAAVGIAAIRVINYLRMSKEEQEAAIKAHQEALLKAVTDWLLRGVTEAEKELGSETGKLKLRAVYERAIELFGPEFAQLVSLEQFDKMVQAPLEEMRKMLENNQSAKIYVTGAAGGSADAVE